MRTRPEAGTSCAAFRQRSGVALAVLLVASCSPSASLPPNLVLITLDTTRADHLGVYGHAGGTSPNLDRFAEKATVYERAYATSSWTLASHASLFTGLLPMQHGAQTAPEGKDRRLDYGVRPLADSFDTLAERLRAAGYRTGAVVAGPALARELGVAQGFEIYRDALDTPELRANGRRAEDVTQQAIEIAAGFGAEPYFLFVNFFDPHAPFRPPPPYDQGLPPDSGVSIVGRLLDRLSKGVASRPLAELPDDERVALDTMRRGYDAEIRYMDQQLGRLLEALLSEPRGAETIIVITADHGESFGEHYYVSHGAHLYDDNTRVPLIVRIPGAAGARVAEPVQNHRLAATLLAAAGIAAEAGLAPPLGAPAGPIVTEVKRSDANVRLFGAFFDRDLVAIYQPPLKLILDTTGRRELFDLEADPDELRNLADARSGDVRSLAQGLDDIERRHPPLFDDAHRAQLSTETQEALRALGYGD